MARAASTDPFLNFKFHVVDPAGGHLDPVAGFTTVSTPDITVDPAEYREGVYRWTRKYPGVQTVGELQLMKGTVKRDSDFFKWVLDMINGGQGEYRTDLMIMEFHITDEFGIQGSPSRIMRCREAWPSQVKPMADKDATGSEVAIQELTLTIEELEIEIIAGEGAASTVT
jgi:phage tail-like protein